MEAPIAIPERPGNREVSFVMDSAVARSASPFSLTEQVYVWPGQKWRCIMKLPAMAATDALAWQAFFADLNGMAGTFWVHDVPFIRPTEIDFGLPELDGAHVSGPIVKTRGWNPLMRVLFRGQKIEVGGRLRQVMADTYSDSGGKAEIRCWPACRGLADALPVEWQDPKGVFRASSVPEFTWDVNRLQNGFQFSTDEVILP